MASLCPDCGQEIPEGAQRCPLCSTLDSDPSRDARLGKTVAGRYRLVKRLGRGGMGVVYLAEHLGVGQKVAIKFLHANWSADPELVHRFRNEARTYGQINHPNAVQLHDFGEDESGSLFISMEYVDGLDLKRTLERDRRLSPRDALDVALQCCEVLGAAHAQGIVHRDLKPENLMLTPGLRGFHVKVLDFGLAHLMGSSPRLTAPGMVCGTPRYMAPEQAEGAAIDLRVDVYALGLVLFEALTGTMPFDAPSVAETLRRQLTTPLPHLSDAAPDLPRLDRLDAAIQKATAKKPGDRFASMIELAQELSAEADALPRGESVAKPAAARKPRRVVAIAAACVPLVAAVTAALLLSGPSESELRRPLDALYAANREPAPPVACRERSKDNLKKLAAAAPHLRDAIADASRAQEGATALAALAGSGEGSPESAYLVARARVQAGQAPGAALATACDCPKFAAAENLAGNAALLAGRAEEAEQHYRDAVRAEPRFAKAQLNLALDRFQQRQPEEALRLLGELAAEQPDFAEAQQGLAVIHAALGHADDAQKAWCKARELGLAKAAEHCP